MDLNREIRADVARYPGAFAVYARNLSTGATVELDADRVMPTESAAKTFVLMTYCDLVERGGCDPDARIPVPEDFRLHGSGVLRYLRAGLRPTIEDLAVLMMIVSDNVATALLLLELGGPDRVNDLMTNLGLGTARLASFEEMAAGNGFATSSPRDLAEAYTYLDDRAREILYHQQDQIGLSRRLHYHPLAVDHGLPVPVRVYNKTGTGPGNFIDSGLFETDDSRWVIAAIATGQNGFTSCPDDDAPIAMGHIGKLIHDAWAVA